MKKKILLSLMTLAIAFHITGCTSSDTAEDSDVISDSAENIEGGEEGDTADLAVADSDEASATSDLATEDSLSADDLTDDSGGTAVAENASTDVTTETTTTTSTTEESTDLSDPAVENVTTTTSTETLPAEPMADATSFDPAATTTSTPPPTEYTPSEVAPSQTTMIEESTSTTTTEVTKVNRPLQKMDSTPRQVDGIYFNTVYFARPNDSWSKISTKIYGDGSKVAELKKGNPGVRNPRPGDKIYYNSPKRSNDGTRVITYFEDNGIAPQTYTSKPGDNIRTISKELLGYKDAWKEVWASNSVEGKNEIPEGTTLQYWTSDTAVAAAPAPGESAPTQEALPPAQAVADLPPPPAPTEAEMMGELPPPPTDMAQAPPPPPSNDLPPPPPPPPMDVAAPQMQDPNATAQGEVAATPEMDQDTTMAIGAVGIAVIGLVALIMVRRKRKQKESDDMMSQVGT